MMQTSNAAPSTNRLTRILKAIWRFPLTRIILAGIPDQHPKLKLVCPHVGGALPYLVGRIDHQTMVLKRGAEHIRRAPSEYLRQVWLDTVSPLAMSIRYGFDFVGPDRLLYASDHPWVDPKLIADNVRSLRFSAEEEGKIFGGDDLVFILGAERVHEFVAHSHGEAIRKSVDRRNVDRDLRGMALVH